MSAAAFALAWSGDCLGAGGFNCWAGADTTGEGVSLSFAEAAAVEDIGWSVSAMSESEEEDGEDDEDEEDDDEDEDNEGP